MANFILCFGRGKLEPFPICWLITRFSCSVERFLILKLFHVSQEMLEAACMELCSLEDQQRVQELMSTPAMRGVEFEVVVQKPGQVVKTMDPHVVLARGGTFCDSANFATCWHIKNVSMERQWSLREDRRRVSI